MSKETMNIRGVTQRYGAFETGGAAGIIKTEGATNQMVVDLSGEVLDSLIVPPQHMPAGASVKKAYIFVTEVFVLAGASVVEFGEAGAEVTNGVSLLEANLEALGYVNVTSQLAGTWAAGSLTVGSDAVGIAFSAGSVTTASAGRAKLVIEYEYL